MMDEQKETMSYTDVAYLVLTENGKKMQIQDLFKKVIKVMDLPEEEYERSIGDFFELITTDKRFIILDGGFCDLKINHSTKVIIDDYDEDFEITTEDDTDESQLNNEDSYDDESLDDLDNDDDLDDLVIIDDSEENDGDML